MEKLKNILFNKVTIGAILLLLQLAWLLLFFYQLSSYSTVITAILGLVSVLMMLAIVSSKDNPVYKIGWLILIGLMPMFGTFLYLISANKQPAKKLRRAIQESEARIEQQLEQVIYPQQSLPIADEVKWISDYIASQGTYARHGNTDVAYNGGINIADEYINVDSKLGHWKDTGLRLEGDGVANLTLMFLSVWDACRKDFLKTLVTKINKKADFKGFLFS